MSADASPLAAAAARGVTDPRLRALLVDHADWLARWEPLRATALGDHRFDDRLAPRDAAAREQRHRERGLLLARAATIAGLGLDEADQATWMTLLASLRADGVAEVASLHEWVVSPRGAPAAGVGGAAVGSPVAELALAVELAPLGDAAAGDRLLARLGDGVRAIDATIANLATGLARHRVAPAPSIARAIAQLDAALAAPVEAWPFVAPAVAAAAAAGWPADARARFAAAITALADGPLRAALGRYRALLADRLLPRARAGGDEGLGALKGGAIAYRALVEVYVGEALEPRELHALGRRELARAQRELAALGAACFGAADLAATLAHLRAHAPGFADEGAVIAAASAFVARATAAAPRWFGPRPGAPLAVRAMPAHEAGDGPTAAYLEPSPDGARAGALIINASRPATRPRHEVAAVCAHEGVPGHHLQITRALLADDLPLLRAAGGPAAEACVEGWALYAEGLADEMGLYADDLERLGRWNLDAWRSARLVVDTGLHALGWTRAEAEAFLVANVAASTDDAAAEVDRYLCEPGQALSYKLGQLAILELRAAAEEGLRERFDPRAFHDVILGAGAVTLPVLRMIGGRWLMASGAVFEHEHGAHDHGHDHGAHDHGHGAPDHGAHDHDPDDR